MSSQRNTIGSSERFTRRGLTALTVGLAAGAGMRAEAVGERPNILMIIADDFGVDSHPFYNADTNARFPPTPNINRLYTNGVMFRNCYSYPTSSPTRSCMLTGRYGFRTGIGYAIVSNEAALTHYELTIPELMQTTGSGYDCAMFGKWHCELTPEGPNEIGGFPLFIGGLHGQPIPKYDFWKMVSNGVERYITAYSTEFIVSNATQWIASRPAGANWFCWVAFHSVHIPLHLPPTNTCPSYTYLPGTQIHIDNHPREYWEAMAESLDWGVGRLLDAVDMTDTLVLFVGDNGTIGQQNGERVIQEPYPIDRSKATLYQGGINVPMFVAGAGVSNAMRVCSNHVSVVDFFATILEAAGVEYAPYFSDARPLDSRSFKAALHDPAAPPHREFTLSENFNNTDEPLAKGEKGRAILDSRYKYIAFDSPLPHAFYDLWRDPYEATNLYGAALSPDQSNRLANLQLEMGRLQNFPCITDVQAQPDELAVEFINAVEFSLWSSTNLLDSSWTLIANAVTITNETEVRFSSLPHPTNAMYYRLTAPAR